MHSRRGIDPTATPAPAPVADAPKGGAFGLGFEKDVPKAFSPLAFATSAVVASRLAHDVIYHGVTLQSLKVVLAGFAVLVIAIRVAPLLALVGPLAAAKRRALLDCGALVGEHGRLLRRRWILGEAPKGDALLSTQVPIKEILKKIVGALL